MQMIPQLKRHTPRPKLHTCARFYLYIFFIPGKYAFFPLETQKKMVYTIGVYA